MGIIPENFLFSQQKSSLLAPKDAELIQYDPAAAMLLPGGKILSENQLIQRQAEFRDGKRQIPGNSLWHSDLVIPKVTYNYGTSS